MNISSLDKFTGSVFLGAIVGIFTTSCVLALPNQPTGAIEQKYYADGPWAVTTEMGGACCDSKGNSFDLYYPTNLGQGGFKHPIITWGNGTTLKPETHLSYFLRHLATWGFVIIATQDGWTGQGETILDAATFLAIANAAPGGKFHDKLNVNQIGAIGHSQGAGGALHAMIKSAIGPVKIKTAIAIELPGQQFCVSCTRSTVLDTSKIMTGAVFFVDGSLDLPVSPPTQLPWVKGFQSIAAYYDAVPNNILKLKGTLKGAAHNDIGGEPGCDSAPAPCINGVYGYLGYPTAWMVDQLEVDSATAHPAFVSGIGELFSETTNWELVKGNLH